MTTPRTYTYTDADLERFITHKGGRISATIAALAAELLEARREHARAEWTDDDKPLPEDAAISAAHPMESGSHDTYLEAMRLVGAKRSKGALVDLVNWLLVERRELARRRSLRAEGLPEDLLDEGAGR